jgi:3-oxoacyl-ACP reductase-like protein
MTQLMDDLIKAQPDSLFILAGLVLIAIGVIGSIKTYIDPGKYGRIGAFRIGTLLVIVGFILYARQPAQPAAAAPANPPASATTTTTAPAAPTTATPATALVPPAAAAPAAPGTEVDSAVCTFTAGPLSGATHLLPRARPHPVGSPCHDMKGDRGTIVAPNTPLTP